MTFKRAQSLPSCYRQEEILPRLAQRRSGNINPLAGLSTRPPSRRCGAETDVTSKLAEARLPSFKHPSPASHLPKAVQTEHTYAFAQSARGAK